VRRGGALEERVEVRSAERTVGGSDDADFTGARITADGSGVEKFNQSQSFGTKCCKKTWDADSDGGDFERAKRSGKIASGRYGTRNENVGENGERTESTGTDMENAETVYYI